MRCSLSIGRGAPFWSPGAYLPVAIHWDFGQSTAVSRTVASDTIKDVTQDAIQSDLQSGEKDREIFLIVSIKRWNACPPMN